MQNHPYKDDSYVCSELCGVRKVMTDRNSSREDWDVVFRVLGLLLLNCSENVAGLVEATLSEATLRRTYV